MVRKRARLRKIQVFKLGRYLLLDKVMCGFLNLDMDVSLFWTLKGVFFYLWKISVLSSYFFLTQTCVFFWTLIGVFIFFYPDHRIFFSFLDIHRCILVQDIIQKVYFSPLTYLDVCLFWTLPWTYVQFLTSDIGVCLVSHLGHRVVFVLDIKCCIFTFDIVVCLVSYHRHRCLFVLNITLFN